MNPVEHLLASMIEAAEEQIEAARKLDPISLELATARRQDMLFELELERENNNINVTDLAKEQLGKLEQLDGRLMALLETVSLAAQRAGVGKTTPVYGSDGRVQR